VKQDKIKKIKRWKKHLSEWARCQKGICGIYFTKKWIPDLAFDNFKPRLESGIFQMHLLAERFSFQEWWSGFSERGNQDISIVINVTSLFSVFKSIVCEYTGYPRGPALGTRLHMTKLRSQRTASRPPFNDRTINPLNLSASVQTKGIRSIKFLHVQIRFVRWWGTRDGESCATQKVCF
jgi:hypothetical protein